MDILQIVLTSFLSFVFLFLLTKLIGNKQMSQLNMFDYLNGITIGSITAEMATSLEADWLKPLTAMVVYVILVIIVQRLTNVSIKIRRFCEGKCILLFDNGVIYDRNFSRAHLDLNEFMTALRVKGFFNLSDIETVLLEADGNISILPKSDKRPMNPSDMNITPPTERIASNVILDGCVLHENLKKLGKNEKWLLKQLKSQDIMKVEDVFAATCDNQMNLSVYLKTPDKIINDPFE